MSSQNDYQSNGRYDNIYSQIDSEAKMSFSVDVLANIAIELQRGIGHCDRFQRLITTLRQVLECDASALLRYDSRQFIPLAIDGLAKDVLGRRFALEGHPRLEAIARAGDVVRFPADSELPDPYDGLIPRAGESEGSRLRWSAIVCRAKPDRRTDARRDAARSVRCFQRRRATADCCAGGGSVKQCVAD